MGLLNVSTVVQTADRCRPIQEAGNVAKLKAKPKRRDRSSAATRQRREAEIARGVASLTALSDWHDPEVTDHGTELAAAWRRGHGRCALCGGRVSLARPYRHPLEATLDHRIPINRGHDDRRANLQIAHRGCNSRKGAR
jgi:5-methylcytosine-specific restriction endonuclease McrA